jgi:KUP system potassium uptake protein
VVTIFDRDVAREGHNGPIAIGPSSSAAATIRRPAISGSLPALGLSALGVVFGDIGTSPLYTLKTVLGMAAGTPDPATTLGLLSLVIWRLIVVTTV